VAEIKIFIDLDGTLLNSRERLYFLFKTLVPECELYIDDYWDLKRAKVTHKQILSKRYRYTDKQIVSFETAWMYLIEEQGWLDRDILFVGVREHLQKLRKAAALYLLTARQRSEMVDYQLDRVGLKEFFVGVYVTGGKLRKDDALASLSLTNDDWMIGDTGQDIMAGKRLGMRTASVTNGFLSKESLLPYRPDLILENFTDFNIDLLKRN
jgi:phosphoglycolate phosphatase